MGPLFTTNLHTLVPGFGKAHPRQLFPNRKSSAAFSVQILVSNHLAFLYVGALDRWNLSFETSLLFYTCSHRFAHQTVQFLGPSILHHSWEMVTTCFSLPALWWRTEGVGGYNISCPQSEQQRERGMLALL